MRRSLVSVLLVAWIGGSGMAAGGCAATREEGDEPRRRSEAPGRPASVLLDLAATDAAVHTIQLYRTGEETALPVLPLGAGGSASLTLEFDLMAERGQPLSVYFYHADRSWRRDLTPGEYLGSFQRDDLLDYAMSLGTDVPYVHYTYRFPNKDISFLLSGNYILRVAAQGDEEAVLFERAFFVTEQGTPVEMATERVMLGGTAYPAVQPIVAFRPAADLNASAFDYHVCFVRNGRVELARCTNRPSLSQQPVMEFYLEPQYAFEPEGASYFLDLGLLQVGNQIARMDRSVRPYRLELEPDYARFGSSGIGRLLNGQTVVSGAVRGGNADTEGQYVRVNFRFVTPDEAQLSGEVLVVGSFNNWQLDRGYRLTWVPEAGRYEGDLLLKQGQYEYRYVARDRRLERALVGTMPRAENHYAAFVYYRDVRVNTDRLIAVNGVTAP